MKIWVDADACPQAIKKMLYKVAERLKIELILVANCPLTIPRSELISSVLVASGPDVADLHIAAEADPKDLVVTGDIPLAAKIVEKGAICIDPRGEIIDAENVGGRLSMRNFMEEMRSGGLVQGGPASPTAVDHTRFANSLDRLLTKRLREDK